MRHRSLVLILPLLAFLGLRSAAGDPDPYAKKLKGPSDEGVKAIPRIQKPKGTTIDLVAAEPLLANPIAFCIDEKGRFYVAETFRLHAGVPDNRGRPWLEDELASRTVADRIAMYKKYKYFAEAGKEHDRVRLVWDSDGDGKADKATIFADGFNKPEDGLGSGLIARGNKVWYTNIPHLWRLEDKDGDGKADVKDSLHYGYGVHCAFIGHDLHGLRFGPDGKLYFSIGDRGAHIEKDGKVIVSAPDTGSVFRCNPDGSNLEIVHTGLRNPQELAFDDHGNLFTGDNNADGGDKARWVHIVEGGDSGWRIGYQYLKNLGPWNAEKIWHTQHAGQPGHHLPPLAHIGNGPSGLTYNPGVTLLPEKYKNHFFLVDFRGGSGGSGIHAFSLEPKGASFKVNGLHNFVWSLLATDCDFGPDGGFYISDWVEGWGLTGKGRIYKVYEAERAKDAKILEVKRLLADGMEKRDKEELAKLLGHADQRVRQEAQFELAKRRESAVLQQVAAEGKGLARLHAIWGLGQYDRSGGTDLFPALLVDPDPEVRAQAAKVLGDRPWVQRRGVEDLLAANLKHKEPRVRFFSAMAIGQRTDAVALPAIIEMIRQNKGSDPYLRHAGVMALTSIGDAEGLKEAATDASVAVRHAVLLALRRQNGAAITRFLEDTDPYLIAEAARAINDAPIPDAMPKLAALANKPGVNWGAMPAEQREPILLRALNANFRLGQKEHAEALAAFAASERVPENMRVEALTMLNDWAKPSQRDRLVGVYRPLKDRPAEDAAAAFKSHLAGIMVGGDKVRGAGAKVAARFGIKEVGPVLREMATDVKRPVSLRIDTLRALEQLKDKDVEIVARATLKDEDPRLRSEGRRITLSKLKPDLAVLQIDEVLKAGHYVERQGALELLARLKTDSADKQLADLVTDVIKGKTPAEIRLDVLEAARSRNTAELKKRLAEYDAGLDAKDHLAKWRTTLAGGDAEAGRRVYFEKTDLSCVRCHKIAGFGGEVGPDLTGIATKQKRDYLLESIVDPNKQIAKGFETVVLNLLDGTIKTGVLKSEDKKEVRLVTPEGNSLVVRVDDIETRGRGPSAMPADLHTKMSARELRDLVEYLSTLK